MRVERDRLAGFDPRVYDPDPIVLEEHGMMFGAATTASSESGERTVIGETPRRPE